MNPMQEALALARVAAGEDEVPVGAVVVHEGQIVGKGYNRREADHNPVAHAEILALQEAARQLGSWRLIDCTLYVTLEPCPMCLAACQQARVARVVYGAQDPKGGALSLKYPLHEDVRLNHRFAVEYAPAAECETVLKDFFKTKRKLLTSK
jgi:tRNA(adenine34) deaminase